MTLVQSVNIALTKAQALQYNGFWRGYDFSYDSGCYYGYSCYYGYGCYCGSGYGYDYGCSCGYSSGYGLSDESTQFCSGNSHHSTITNEGKLLFMSTEYTSYVSLLMRVITEEKPKIGLLL